MRFMKIKNRLFAFVLTDQSSLALEDFFLFVK